MKILITGGCGFVGSNLALKLHKNYEVYCLDSFSKNESKINEILLKEVKIPVIKGDISNTEFVNDIVNKLKPDFLFHFAAQVAMTDSVNDPRYDFETNLLGTFNLLNAIKYFSVDTKFLNISTNKVYGDLSWDILEELETRYSSINNKKGYDERTPLSFSGPYGCSKGSAEQYTLDYNRTFSLNTTSLRLSTIYGPNQHSTINQGWIGWFLQQIINNSDKKIIEIPVHGNGKQVRDILYIDDFVDLMLSIIKNFDNVNGLVFNVGGSLKNSLSVIEVLNKALKIYGLKSEIKLIKNNWRPADQKYYVSNIEKIEKKLQWFPKTTVDNGLSIFAKWIQNK